MNYKFSIITPEHKKENIPFLMELYETIQSQTYSNWEWVIYLNGNCKISDIPKELKDDDKVKIHCGLSHSNIGFIKNKAFSLGRGDILVEVDHDDLISEDCLEELNNAYQDEEIGFVYSETLLYDMRGEHFKRPWDPCNGWTFEWINFRGENYIKHNSFPPTSRSVGIIWYAPDHIRSWRKSVYQELGGHNVDLNICDDHELVVRTYLKTKFYFIPKVLYYYRWLPENNNTSTERNASIQIKTFEIFNQYAQKLAERDCELNNLFKVNLSNDGESMNSYITIGSDNSSDVVFDLNDGIPLPDNSVGIVNAKHILQKIKDPIKIMGEINRVLCDGGWAFIEVPSTDGRGAWQDPTHVSFWNENSFWYYTRKDQAKYIKNNNIKFQKFKLETNWWDNNIAITHAWLCAIKSNNPRPHPITI